MYRTLTRSAAASVLTTGAILGGVLGGSGIAAADSDGGRPSDNQSSSESTASKTTGPTSIAGQASPPSTSISASPGQVTQETAEPGEDSGSNEGPGDFTPEQHTDAGMLQPAIQGADELAAEDPCDSQHCWPVYVPENDSPEAPTGPTGLTGDDGEGALPHGLGEKWLRGGNNTFDPDPAGGQLASTEDSDSTSAAPQFYEGLITKTTIPTLD